MLENLINQAKNAGRGFVMSTAIVGAAACGGGGATGNNPVEPRPVYTQGQGSFSELLTNAPLDGQIVLPNRTIPVTGGKYNITSDMQILQNSTIPNVILTSPGCVDRKTTLSTDSSGLFVDLGYKKGGLNVICDQNLYGQFTRTRVAGQVIRWDPRTYKGAFLFDRQLIGKVDGQFTIIDRNYPVEPTFIESVQNIANNQISSFTGGTLPNGVKLASQTPESQWPTIYDDGWLLYYTNRDNMFYLDAGAKVKNMIVVGSIVSITPNRKTNDAAIEIDTREAVGQYNDSSAPNDGPWREFGIIQYNRKHQQSSCAQPDCEN